MKTQGAMMVDKNADANAMVIATFRQHAGVVGGPFEGKRLILLHHVGRSSGEAYVSPLVAAMDDDAYLVCGTAGGGPNDPEWVANLEQGPPATTIEVGDRSHDVLPTVVRANHPEWSRLYGIWSQYWPDAKEYETRTTRMFPVVRLKLKV